MNAIIFVISLFFLALFLGGCLTDVESRWDVQPTNLKAPGATPTTPGAVPAGSTGAPVMPAPVQPAH